MALGFSDPTKAKQVSVRERNIREAERKKAACKKAKSAKRQKMAAKSRNTTFAVKRRA